MHFYFPIPKSTSRGLIYTTGRFGSIDFESCEALRIFGSSTIPQSANERFLKMEIPLLLYRQLRDLISCPVSKKEIIVVNQKSVFKYDTVEEKVTYL